LAAQLRNAFACLPSVPVLRIDTSSAFDDALPRTVLAQSAN